MRRKTKAEPAPLKFINFKRPIKKETFPSVLNDTNYELKGYSTNCSENDENDELLKSLHEAATDAAIFKSINWATYNSSESETDSADETEKPLPRKKLLTRTFNISI